MDVTTMEHTVQQLKSIIFERIRHNTLQLYTGTPLLQEEQLFFLLLPQFNQAQWSEQTMNGAVTTAIVHSSLREHDKILSKEVITKEQQLIVLAGDFYSGRYYQLLAQAGNILLIQKLSEAIIARCEHEIKVYEEQSRTFSEWVNSLIVIETALITGFYEVFGFTRYNEVMQQALTIVALQKIVQQQQGPFANELIRGGQAQIVQQIAAMKKQLSDLLTQGDYSEVIQQKILMMVS